MKTDHELALINLRNRIAAAYKILEIALEYSWARNVEAARRELREAIRAANYLDAELLRRPTMPDHREVITRQINEQREYMRAQGETLDGYVKRNSGDVAVATLEFNTDCAELLRRKIFLEEFDLRRR
jgi:hypothetical protein